MKAVRKMYKPPAQMTTPMKLQKCAKTEVTGAINRDYYDAPDDPVIMCSFKSKGGTEAIYNGKLTILDTAMLEMWYRPDVQAGDRFVMLSDGSKWDIKGRPENIEQRNQLLVIKVQRAGG